MLPSARGLCCPCHKHILEQASLVNVLVVPEEVLTWWHVVFTSCYNFTGMQQREAAERKAAAGGCTVV